MFSDDSEGGGVTVLSEAFNRAVHEGVREGEEDTVGGIEVGIIANSAKLIEVAVFNAEDVNDIVFRSPLIDEVFELIHIEVKAVGFEVISEASSVEVISDDG